MFRRRALAAALVVALSAPVGVFAQPTDNADELVQLDFRDVELTVIIDTIAKVTGKNFIYDDRVRGRVTIISPTKITIEQAYAVFESVLKVKGFTAVPGPGDVLKIIPVRDAKESSIEIVKDDRRSPNRDTFVTRLIPLRYVDARGVARTSVLVYMDKQLPRQAAERAQVHNFAAQERATVHYEYTTALPNVLNLRDVPATRIDALKRLPGVIKVEMDEYHPNLIQLDEATPPAGEGGDANPQ